MSMKRMYRANALLSLGAGVVIWLIVFVMFLALKIKLLMIISIVAGVVTAVFSFFKLNKFGRRIIEEEESTKLYVTEMTAIDLSNGKLTLFNGPLMRAFTMKEAIDFCRENMPYLKVTGELTDDNYGIGPIDNTNDWRFISNN